jgi:uncharacterized membrane protein YkvA (DUF1232 family)
MKSHNNRHHDSRIRRVVRAFGRTLRRALPYLPCAREAVAMYHCLLDPATPLRVKATIVGALLYFVAPLDAIPDALVPVGWTDDVAVLLAAWQVVQLWVTAEHLSRADEFLGGCRV